LLFQHEGGARIVAAGMARTADWTPPRKIFPAPRRIALLMKVAGTLPPGQAQDTSTATPLTASNPPPLSTTGLTLGQRGLVVPWRAGSILVAASPCPLIKLMVGKPALQQGSGSGRPGNCSCSRPQNAPGLKKQRGAQTGVTCRSAGASGYKNFPASLPVEQRAACQRTRRAHAVEPKNLS
jgi:hypothetical protein